MCVALRLEARAQPCTKADHEGASCSEGASGRGFAGVKFKGFVAARTHQPPAAAALRREPALLVHRVDVPATRIQDLA